eukprot:TRINITY_DN8333_c0_g1_i1.p1 TRINITY_DN8333_c0_g1~~TRINITY_DN8333_c0_g1_i1.p1  ORF type:complete len:251 (+),score=65.05 TRINITY_DN8333_c0_g1_i1:23-775(+)
MRLASNIRSVGASLQSDLSQVQLIDKKATKQNPRLRVNSIIWRELGDCVGVAVFSKTFELLEYNLGVAKMMDCRDDEIYELTIYSTCGSAQAYKQRLAYYDQLFKSFETSHEPLEAITKPYVTLRNEQRYCYGYYKPVVGANKQVTAIIGFSVRVDEPASPPSSLPLSPADHVQPEPHQDSLSFHHCTYYNNYKISDEAKEKFGVFSYRRDIWDLSPQWPAERQAAPAAGAGHRIVFHDLSQKTFQKAKR